jgi:predicted hotdog family 3-hydroxylacyl-ACP dehydratase
MSVSSEGDPGYRPRHRPPAWLAVERPTPAQAAAAYRALRKSREDNKDEPGAAEFYYGEMEMRRHANARRSAGNAGGSTAAPHQRLPSSTPSCRSTG